MIETGALEAWTARGIAGALVAAGAALFLRVRRNEARLAVIESRDGGALTRLESRAGEMERELRELRLSVTETYVRRDDYMPQLSQILAKLDAQAALLARLDERSRRWETQP